MLSRGDSDLSVDAEAGIIEDVVNEPLISPSVDSAGLKYNLNICQTTMILLANVLIGIVVGIALLYAFKGGLPLRSTPLHIVLCVVGYQLLMGQAILSLSGNSWSSRLTLEDRRRAHWILQLLGSGLAIAGSIIKILDKKVHWDTLHGRFGLAALVFTSASLVNGLTSLYFYELRRFLNGNLSKLTHICFGTVAFVMASACLCYGFDKHNFRKWDTEAMTTALIVFVATFTFIIVMNPLLTVYRKSVVAVRNRSQ